MKPITEGFHPWNLHPTRQVEKRECPKCRKNIIEDNKCLSCGYSPECLIQGDPEKSIKGVWFKVEEAE